MQKLSCRRHRFHPDIIRQAVWLSDRFTLSFRDVEDGLAERGIDVICETVRLRVFKFGPAFARRIYKRGDPAFDVLVQKRRGKRTASRLMRKLLEQSGQKFARRERKMQRFKSQKSARRFLSTDSPIYNLFNLHRHLISRHALRTFRTQAMAEWQTVTAG